MPQCQNCHQEISDRDTTCPHCGRNQRSTARVRRKQEYQDTDPGHHNKNTLSKVIIPGNRYEILEHVGEGGMADVYKARDKELDEIVALKILKSSYSKDEDMIARFKREIKIARKVKHNNVCGIYDFGFFEGTFYISMEYVPGETLTEVMWGRRLGGNIVIDILRGLIDALQVAHQQHIIHRDLKPQNIILLGEKPIITDFGIARHFGQSDLTKHDEILGSPNYMSPEQVLGRSLDQRSDIYSLGIILYQMVTGILPFAADTPILMALKQVNELPRHVNEINPDVPATIQKIIMKCLEKSPENRYQNVSEILPDLEPDVTASPELVSKVTILIADDDEDMRGLMKKWLEKEGYGVLSVTNGEEAVAKAIAEKPDLICLDYMMPTMDGYQAAEFLLNNESTANIPIIMITATSDQEYKAYSKSIGIKDFITKPVRLDTFLEKIKNILSLLK
ncbi:protein kinase [candidate division CSSED10-310 bacterium]|uniref:Protein kinase n=1 Tax=candidate division CSSED10-310 bacterium TaxID=2855610 RepID=A0ABV6YWK1_UNCC1